MSNYQNYLKGIVATLGAILTGLAPFYGSAHWFPVVSALVTAVTVTLVPNISSKPATPTVIVPPVVPTSILGNVPPTL